MITFGDYIICGDCDGTTVRPLNDDDKRERSRELRIAKRRKEPPPPLVHPSCGTCNGTGVLKMSGKYVP